MDNGANTESALTSLARSTRVSHSGELMCSTRVRCSGPSEEETIPNEACCLNVPTSNPRIGRMLRWASWRHTKASRHNS
jgi:hypothetical protein